MSEKKKRTVCIYHIAELYLFEYYERPGDYEVSREDLITPLLEKGTRQEKQGGYIGALQTFEKALDLNPAKTEIYFHLLSCSYHVKDLDAVAEWTKKLYPYVCTREELAAYYRWRGLWCLEKFQPDLSRALYRYSTYFAESAEAENEIRYLDTAMNWKGEPAREEVQKKLREQEIPLTAANITVALVYRAGEEAERAGNPVQALDCFRMVYDLSEDPEVGERIRSLEGRT